MPFVITYRLQREAAELRAQIETEGLSYRYIKVHFMFQNYLRKS
jgi:hypothetical protein